jgi:hypothetical protein
MLPDNKYYSLFTFIFGILAKFRIPERKSLPCYARLLMKRQRLTCFLVPTPNLPPGHHSKMENGMPSSSLQMATYVRSLLQSC